MKHQATQLHKGGVHISEHIKESIPVPGMHLFTLKNSAEGIAVITGSILGGRMYSPKENPVLALLVVAMLDQGTIKKDKNAINDELEHFGASIQFSLSEFRVQFTIRCMSKDIEKVLALLYEQLRSPKFGVAEFAVMQKRMIAELLLAKEDTERVGSIALSQSLFPKDHPNYQLSIPELITAIKRTKVRALKEFHKKNYGLGSSNLVVVGDVSHKEVEKKVSRVFSGWRQSPLTLSSGPYRRKILSRGKKEIVFIPDKTSVNVLMGQSIGINNTHPDYYPLLLGVQALGGDFCARLMMEVRERQGLTYSIYSLLSGTESGVDGFWFINGSFAPELLQKGEESTSNELFRFAREGISAKELRERKETIIGSFDVSLESTHELAAIILHNKEEGRERHFLDHFPALINAITQAQVNSAISRYLNTQNVVQIAVGTIGSKNKKG
ncbi:MAG: insulinase family protein [Patescibacteria group bacterium]|nr:insulinase family protein [Patescibacteria group bacterium]